MRITETIPSRLEIIPEYVSLIMERLYHLPLDEQAVFNVKLALLEAVVNAAKHGNKLNNELKVYVDIIEDRDRLTIEVTDEGEGYDYRSVPNPTRRENILKAGGRGVFLIRYAMNRVEFFNKGRTIRMVKVLKKKRRVKVQTQIEKIDDITIVQLTGEINVNNCNDVRAVYSKIVQEGGKKVLVDFAKVTFIDSSGLAILIELVQKLKEVNGKLSLCYVNKKILGIFEITKIHRLMDIHETREAALKGF